jgi:membrane protein implicated in regulation of membrane protease activity
MFAFLFLLKHTPWWVRIIILAVPVLVAASNVARLMHSTQEKSTHVHTRTSH